MPETCGLRGIPKTDDNTQATPRMTQTQPTVQTPPNLPMPAKNTPEPKGKAADPIRTRQRQQPSCGLATEARSKPKNCPQPPKLTKANRNQKDE
ncbi:MAG: hypothetical protein Q8N96_05255 [Methylovulum sp.]|nr:hypothetical protein [Methylovulum sp.]